MLGELGPRRDGILVAFLGTPILLGAPRILIGTHLVPLFRILAVVAPALVFGVASRHRRPE
jgi:hypothetical protein